MTSLKRIFIYFWLHWPLLLCTGFFQSWRAGATLCGVLASRCGGFSWCAAQAPGTQASAAAARVYVHAKWLQSCPTLCNSMNHSPPGASVHGILQSRILKWVAVPSSRGFSNPGIEPRPFIMKSEG